MRQVLLNSQGAVVARMPRPTPVRGEVLVRVRYSLISTGTELAALRPSAESANLSTVSAGVRFGASYLGKAVRNPRKALHRVRAVAQRVVSVSRRRQRAGSPPPPVAIEIGWERCGAVEFSASGASLELSTDETEFGYQAMSTPIPVAPDTMPIFEVQGHIDRGVVSIGLLDENRSTWLGTRNLDAGPLSERLVFKTGSSRSVTLVIANAGTRSHARLSLRGVQVTLAPTMFDGLPQSELDDQGWNVGYSLAGEVISVGAGVADLVPGDRVACAGAGKANHADYVSVPRNLCCRIPSGCDDKLAASTTVGAIALQGVRRAAPQLGETLCVLGLGLIGQITAQLLRANGVTVLGFDLDRQRVARALTLGMDAGATDPEALKQLIRDRTFGRGVDRVLITAATKSDSVINLAMDVTRVKGTVVIVGDVGLGAERASFYRKEIDLLMSTSYGPGRYDREYEEQGHDYPFGYVRWTLNRNMQAYLDLIASRRIAIEALVDEVIAVDEAPQAYKALASRDGAPPLGVLISYSNDLRGLPEPADASRIAVRGHRKAPQGLIRYALVGAGAFGTSMLVPQLSRRRDRFFLRGVVSRNTAAAGNFARSNQVEVLATDIDQVLSDPAIDLVVIATRHCEHAAQTMRSLQAGKHVFVEKPLAISWEEFDQLVACYRSLETKPMLMVGFNRRFSPAMENLAQALANRRAPVMVQYRLNGGYIPLDHWVQGPQGGGRNVGEACHMYDVFRFLVGAPVASIAACAIDPAALPYLRSDNFSATLSYDDGSLCNLVYTALGPKQGMAKERVEVFCDGEAWILDDYRSLTRVSDGQVLWQGETDKGHFVELSRLGDAIANATDAPIPVDEIFETTAVALTVDDALSGRAENP